MDLSPCSHIDATGCNTIGTEMGQRLGKKSIQVALVGANAKALRALKRSGALNYIGEEWVFGTVADAVDACRSAQRIMVEKKPRGDAGDDNTGAELAASSSSSAGADAAVHLKSFNVGEIGVRQLEEEDGSNMRDELDQNGHAHRP
jgi:hypothetical protein